MLLQIISATLVVSLVSLLGLLLLARRDWSNFILSKVLAAAAGALLASVFLHLLPELFADPGLSEIKNLSSIILLTILVLVTFEQMLSWHHCQHHDCEAEDGHNHLVGNKSTAYSILVGDSLHNIVDGMVIASAFMASPALGWVATLAIVLHEVPHEIGDFGILIASGFSRTKAALLNLLSALFAVAGALATYYFAQILAYRKVFIAIAVGSFVYVALSDILPELQNHAKKRLWPTIVSLFVGVLVIWLFGIILPDIE